MLLLVDNIHIFKDKHGDYYTPSIYDDSFFNKYLSIFGEIKIVGKVRYIDSPEKLNKLNKKVFVCELPWFKGPRGFAKQFIKVIKSIKTATQGCDCCILRMSQLESILVYIFGNIKKMPFCVETVNDPATFNKNNFLWKIIATHYLKKINKKAFGVSYVTKYMLQSKYPCKAMMFPENSNFFTANYSSIVMLKKDINTKIKELPKGNPKLLHISNNIDDDSKGHVTVLNCLKRLIDDGFECYVDFIGEGSFVNDIKALSNELNISKYVHFLGRFADKKELISKIKEYDIFISPSHAEGLPRTVIEAMSQGLPCFASPVGGTSELLEDFYLIDYLNPNEYAKRIEMLIGNANEFLRVSERNIKESLHYCEEALKPRRDAFYQKLKNLTCSEKGKNEKSLNNI